MFNILFLIGKYPNYGGTEKVTTVLANYLSRSNQVHIASFEQPVADLKNEELNKSINLLKLSLPLNSKKNKLKLGSYLKDQKIDVVINQWCLPFFVTRFLKKIQRKHKFKLISVLHGNPSQNKKLLELRKWEEGNNYWATKFLFSGLKRLGEFGLGLNNNYVYHKSDAYVLLSDTFRKGFIRLSNLKDASKLKVIANPITISTPNNVNTILATKKNEILYVGRMDYLNKRVHRVIEAWENIFIQFPSWKLTLVGDGPEKTSLIDYVKKNNLKRVNFEDFKKEPPIYFYSNASILLLTSDLEGFGLVVIEGMSYGVVPIVYGSYEAIYDIIDIGENGYITPTPYKKENTVHSLIYLMENQVKRESMSIKAYHKAKKFGLEQIGKKWSTLLNGVITK